MNELSETLPTMCLACREKTADLGEPGSELQGMVLSTCDPVSGNSEVGQREAIAT